MRGTAKLQQSSRSPAGGQALKEPQHHERTTRLGLAPRRARLGAERPQDPGTRADGLAAPPSGGTPPKDEEGSLNQ
jgi:hypothetical protein